MEAWYNLYMTRAISIDPEVQGGTPCFAGTRVPVQTLFDYVAHGRSLDYFLEQFPSVRRDFVLEVLEQAGKLVSSREDRPAA